MAKLSKGQIKLRELEKMVKGQGVRLGYEKLQFAGLRLRSGLCWFRGQYYLFVDRLKSVPERIDLLQNALEELDLLKDRGPEQLAQEQLEAQSEAAMEAS